jgi:hypothetical protein
MVESVFVIKKADIRQHRPTIQKLTSSELLVILEEHLRLTNQKPTGFSLNKLPDKAWLLDVIFTLDRDNSIFKKEEAQRTILIPMK